KMTVNIKSASIDQTPLFKAMTKIKATKQGKVVSVPSPSSTPVFSLLTRQLGEIAAELVDLMKLVLTKRADYLAFNTFHPVMTDGQRDRFDNDTLKALTGLKIVVNTTQERIKMEQMRDEEKDHLKAVAEGLERRIKHIVDICGQMRTARLVHLARRKRDFKLAHLVQEKKAKEMNSRLSPVNSFNSLLAFEKQGEQEVRRRKIDTEDWEGFENSRDGKKDNETVFEEMERREREEREREERRKVLTVEEMEHTTSTVLPEAGDAERVQLMEENERTYDRLANVHKEMDGVEMQVAEIQRLQETFAEKLMEQEQDIEILHEQAQNTTENLREANDFIREAITNSASRRVVILFCIVVLTFAILWVDWYNP
ncbi:hypothetical protein PENTCL1PPCAC_1800, partial [Pristionchus entomophagus]